MQRRSILSLTAPMLATIAPEAARAAERTEATESGGLGAALRHFRALPGSPSYLLHVGEGGSAGRFAHRSNLRLFIASAYKTFVLGQYLREVEAGRLSLDEQVAIDDEVRNIGSPVLVNLTGTTTARSVLEAMITRSDNMATDIASRKAGPDRVRALIAEAGLRTVQVPDTTRLFESYVFGAPPGTDIGWAGLQRILENPPTSLRPALNDEVTLAGTTRDLEQIAGGRERPDA